MYKFDMFEILLLLFGSLGFGFLFGITFQLKENLTDITDSIKCLKYDELEQENKKLRETIKIIDDD